MSLVDLIRKQFIDVLEWTETGARVDTPSPTAGVGLGLISGFARAELEGEAEPTLGWVYITDAYATAADALMAQLPLSYVRLSPHYAARIDQQAVHDEMRQVIDRAHLQGLQVIGQHVEDPQTAAKLWLSGIDYIQGDLVQRAADAMDFDFQSALL